MISSVDSMRRSRITKWMAILFGVFLINAALVSFTGQSIFGWIGSLLKLIVQFAVVLYLTSK